MRSRTVSLQTKSPVSGKRKFQGQRQGREIGAETLRGRSQRLPRRQEARQLRAFVFCSGNLRERRTAWWGSEDSNYLPSRPIGALVVVNSRRQVRAPDDCDQLLRLTATSLWTGTVRPFRPLPGAPTGGGGRQLREMTDALVARLPPYFVTRGVTPKIRMNGRSAINPLF